jgi:hypothetical protein
MQTDLARDILLSDLEMEPIDLSSNSRQCQNPAYTYATSYRTWTCSFGLISSLIAACTLWAPARSLETCFGRRGEVVTSTSVSSSGIYTYIVVAGGCLTENSPVREDTRFEHIGHLLLFTISHQHSFQQPTTRGRLINYHAYTDQLTMHKKLLPPSSKYIGIRQQFHRSSHAVPQWFFMTWRRESKKRERCRCLAKQPPH